MKIVKKIFFWWCLNEIQKDWKAFEHTQPNLTDITIIINWEYFYWLVTISDESIISK